MGQEVPRAGPAARPSPVFGGGNASCAYPGSVAELVGIVFEWRDVIGEHLSELVHGSKKVIQSGGLMEPLLSPANGVQLAARYTGLDSSIGEDHHTIFEG